MKKLIVSLTICSITFLSHAQQKESFKKVLKIYNLSSYSQGSILETDSVSTNINNMSSFQIVHPTIAFAWRTKNRNYHEIELVNAIVNRFMNKSTFVVNSTTGIKSVSGGINNLTYIGLRYEFILEFMKDSKSDLTASLGFALQPTFIYSHSKTFTTFDFPSKHSSIKLDGFVIPRVNYKINERSFVNLNIPFSLFDFMYSQSKVRDPSVPIKSQKISSWNSEVLPKIYYLRVGYAYRIE